MRASLSVNIAVEGDLDEAVLKKLLNYIGIDVVSVYGRQGKDYLRKRIKQFNSAAEHGKWIILIDLNNEAECAPPLIRSWLPKRSQNLQLRVAVREVEAWLLAERNKLARFLSVSKERIPIDPEKEPEPKLTLINIARHSRNRTILEDLVPQANSTATQGKNYTSRLIEFAINNWEPNIAAYNSPSLKRSIDSLLQWAA
jgi:hypothetical protein